eukprot:TRINITY_DN81507_c0_g1_i1.p1 TRINITY_DN81507_c0_g1~~TRINITY_DN81507_c0_g1_i1.p1  ORF type:complete len:257 (-),score=51.89 TRINITY_DN81507_c0_g1_i1:149-919(-)
MAAAEKGMTACRSLENISLGGVAAMPAKAQLPRKYRSAKPGEKSTYQGAGIVPVTRFPDGKARILLWQPQSGKKMGVRWYDFGGRKTGKEEFTTCCACRKFAKETYGLFGCEVNISGSKPHEIGDHLAELYQGRYNLPLMLKSSQEWAQLQILSQSPKMYYNDVHEYHVYLLGVPYVSADVLGRVSKIVDGGKRVFRWLSREDLEREVLAPRLHTESFLQQTQNLDDDEWILDGLVYDKALTSTATGSFTAVTIGA